MREFRLYGTVVEQANTAPVETTKDAMIGQQRKNR